jgi:hypothetical protein
MGHLDGNNGLRWFDFELVKQVNLTKVCPEVCPSEFLSDFSV